MGCGSSCMAAEHPLSSKTPVGGTARRQHLVRSPAHGKSRGAVDVDRDTGTDFASTSASTGLTVSASSSARSITTTEKADPLDTTDTAVVTVTNHGHLFEIREELNEDEAESTKHSLEKNETRCTNLPATRSFFNGPGRTRGAPQVEVIQVRPATSLQLARVIRPENALQVQRLQQHYASLQSMHEVKMNTLRNLEIFVLDNSVRESTVGAVLGHSVAEKLSIMDLVMGAGQFAITAFTTRASHCSGVTAYRDILIRPSFIILLITPAHTSACRRPRPPPCTPPTATYPCHPGPIVQASGTS